MSGNSWKQEIVSGLAMIAVLGMLAVPAFAQKGGTKGNTIPVKAILITDCGPFCQTDVGGWTLFNQDWSWSGSGTYSLIPGRLLDETQSPHLGTTDGYANYAFQGVGDGTANDGVYLPGSVTGSKVQSEILTHNTVYTLNSLDTLGTDGKVNGNTRTLRIHLYTTASNLPPKCWEVSPFPNDAYTQIQAVNWSIFSDNSIAFPDMAISPYTDQNPIFYPGTARMNFNVRNDVCENNIFRFYLTWSRTGAGITIRRVSTDTWEISTNIYGEAELDGQGGRKQQTQKFGTWRVPFRVILTSNLQ